MSKIASVQAVEDAAGVHLYAFDTDDVCVMAVSGLFEQPAASLELLMQRCLAGEGAALGQVAAEPLRDYAQVTDEARDWEIIAEHDGEHYECYEEDMGRQGLRLAGAGYVLGLLHVKPEGNWFEHAGEGSIWQYVFATPVAAERVLDDIGLDCEIHAIPMLIDRGCRLDGMAG